MARNPKFLEEVSAHFRKDDEIIVVSSAKLVMCLFLGVLGAKKSSNCRDVNWEKGR